MHSAIVLVIVCVIGAGTASPVRKQRSLDPFWHLPCGEAIQAGVVTPENLREEIATTIESLKLQHQLTLTDYLSRDYDFLYERVRLGVHRHQYITNWIPGKKDVNAIKSLSGQDAQIIINHLPKLHSDLQKFAVALEEIIDHETAQRTLEALRSTQSYLQMMLCEVESNIVYLPGIQVPERVPRSIMAAAEREPVDETRRLVRDWGIILKYKEYLHAWRHVFNY